MMRKRYKPIESSIADTYFAGANSGIGFLSEYDRLLSEMTFDKVFIIKGGPGVGKSTAMRKCAERAEECGASVTRYLCGSDPDSLDCIVIEKGEMKIAVLDGTAPHTKDPVLPGAVGEIVDFGRAWDSAKLEEKKNVISELVRRKAECFRAANKLLPAVLELERDNLRLLDCAVMQDKMSGAVRRLIKKLIISGGGSVDFRYAEGITMSGAVRLSTSSFDPERVIGVSDDYGSAPLFIAELYRAASSCGASATVFRSALDPEVYTGILFKEIGTLVTVSYDGNEESCVNMMRFLDHDRLSESRTARRFAVKCGGEMFDRAVSLLGEAREYHFELERIYGDATDYRKINRFTSAIIDNIAQRLG